jgi:hypothetical protein
MVNLGYRNGKRWRKVYEAATRSEVQDKLAKGIHNQQRGINIPPERQTVGQFLDSWLVDVVKPAVKPKT